MAHVADHLSIEDLEDRYRSCVDACSGRHYQTIWLLAQGHTIAEVSGITCFVPRWIEELLCRYNTLGPKAPLFANSLLNLRRLREVHNKGFVGSPRVVGSTKALRSIRSVGS